MPKIFLYIDESKHLKSGILIFGGYSSENSKPYLEKWIEDLKSKNNIPLNKEMKSSEELTGKNYLEDGFIPMKQDQIKGVFGLLASKEYQKDSYHGYLNGLIYLIRNLQDNGFLDGYSEIAIFIDKIKLLSNQKSLEKSLKKELSGIDNRICQVTLISSKESHAIQLADLVTGIFKDEIRGIRRPDFNKAFNQIHRI